MSSVRVIFSPHAEDRVRKRLKLDPEEVRHRIELGIYARVAFVKECKTYYLVLWDEALSDPILIIATEPNEDRVWIITTVYPTMTYHRRKHNVMIMPGHIKCARQKYEKYARRVAPSMHQTPEKIPVLTQYIESNTKVRLLAKTSTRNGKHWQVRTVKVAEIPIDEYQAKFNSLPKYLEWLRETNALEDIPVPSMSYIELELVYSDGKKRHSLASHVLQEAIW